MLAALLRQPNQRGIQPAAMVGSPLAACALYVRGVSFSEPMTSAISQWNPLCILCHSAPDDASKVATVRFILQYLGSDPDASGGSSWKPIICAAYYGFINVVRLLVEFGAEVNVWNDADYGPLHYALRRDHVELLKFLLDWGARPRSFEDLNSLQREVDSTAAMALLDEAIERWTALPMDDGS